jgi:hypothetical protein
VNVLYAVTFPAEPERIDRVRSSIEQCLDASPLSPETHAELARAAAALLELASGWTLARATLAIRVEASTDDYAITIVATRPDGATRTLEARAKA